MSTVMALVKSSPLSLGAAGRRLAGNRGVLDHDLLMGAVASRLRALVAASPASSAVAQPVQEAVRDCAQALELLRPALAQERCYVETLERGLQELRLALAASRLEVAGTRDGRRGVLHMAEHDGLTALLNRRGFQVRLDEALARPAPMGNAQPDVPALAVLLLDLDDFKSINEKHGHQTGDELLRVVAQRLSRAVRGGDKICRLDGDKFTCLIFAPMGRDQLSHVASKLFDVISAPLSVGSLQFTVYPSIGIAMSPQDGNTSATLLQNAGVAMCHAKQRQLGYTFFSGQTST